MIDKDQFSSFIKALHQYVKQNHPDFDGSLSAVRELVSNAIAEIHSNQLIGLLKYSPIPFNRVTFEKLATALQEDFGISMPAELWRWPLPVGFKLSPTERIDIWQAAFKNMLGKVVVDGMWQDSFFNAEPYIKPMGDGKWAVCNRSPVPFNLCKDVFSPEWIFHREADNSIADDATGRSPEEHSFHAGLAALWKKDFQTAFEFLSKAQQNSHPMAAFNLGWMHSEGLGRVQDFNAAAGMYQCAADLGVVTAHHNLGRLYLEGGRNFAKSIPDAIRHFELAAQGGVAASIGCLGMIYLKGNGVPENQGRAIELLSQASNLDDDHSANALATILDHQNGGISTPKTFALYRKAARSARELGHVMPIYNLGLCFLSGNGVDKSLVKARRLFRKAANAGDADAAMNLGLIYLNGEGTPADPFEAMHWFNKSAQSGNKEAFNALGSIEFNGQSGASNESLAWHYFSEAALRGSVIALTNQARCLVTGQGVEQNLGQACELLKLAESQGHPTALEMRIQWEAQA